MDNKDLQNEIVEAAATKAADLTNEAVETKTAEINEKLETKADAAAVEKLAVSVDKLVESQKSFNIGTPKKTNKEEFLNEIKSKANQLSSGGRFTIKTEDFGLTMKDLGIAAGADNYAAYREGMVDDIKYDPNYQTRLTNFLEVYSLPGTGAIRYNQESTHTEPSDYLKAEGAAASQSTFNVQPVTEAANTAMGLITVPNEWMDEITSVNSYVMRRLTGDVLDAVDRQILRGSGSGNSWTGINSHVASANDLDDTTTIQAFLSDSTQDSVDGANAWDVFNAVAAELEGSNFRPNLVILNPVDYRALSWIKSTQNEYVINQAMQANQPFLYFNNLRIVPNAAQTLGDFTLIDSSAAGVFLQKGLTFEFGMNDDDFASNSISARAMVRGGVAGFRPNGLTTGTISLVADELETP